jgi:hypothetical protein
MSEGDGPPQAPEEWVYSIARDLWRRYNSGQTLVLVRLDGEDTTVSVVGRKERVDIKSQSVVNSSNS